MLKLFFNKIIQNLGKKNYKIDENLSTIDLFIFLKSKGFQFIRGLIIKVQFNEAKGFVFIGKGCNLKYKKKISVGKTFSLGDNVEINALSKYGVNVGDNVSIQKNTIIECTGVLRELGEGIKIGNNVGIAQNCFIQVRGFVVIGSHVIIGPGVSIFSENHIFSNRIINIVEQGEKRIGVIIKNNVWIGSNSTILDGVTLGENSIIAAGSVVNKDIPPNTIFGGIPAKLIRNR
jgi:acetyltransferase-like isoleucine patch superfamily enzyme